MFSFFSSQKPT